MKVTLQSLRQNAVKWVLPLALLALPTASFAQQKTPARPSVKHYNLKKGVAISGYDPANVVTLMTSPLSGTLAPSASSRCGTPKVGGDDLDRGGVRGCRGAGRPHGPAPPA